jgi:23S rRNA (cytidine1920-2'-O)/16S rRNA (cytidine1409-2'-O)-methyltransferase
LARLDNYLVEHNFAESRNKAQGLIKDGLVFINGKIINKSSYKVEEGDEVRIEEHKSFVSRSAHKLDVFLNELNLDTHARVALDIGSSTGGFTQVLLERGVQEVTAVDVGRDQLHHSLRENAQVFVYEGCDIREFTSTKVFDLVVSDVAFISLIYILDAVDRLATKDIILLFKPQFEVGREAKRDKNGVVLDQKAIDKAMIKFEDACRLKEWRLVKKSPSSLVGKEGNLEYCYYYEK